MTYVYKCAACGHTWDTEQKITSEPIKICEKCGEEKAQRQICVSNFILCGGGWAKEGYK
jgi:putative FmdB family regulatory protein